ncbi:MAG: GNAT family N-acetyltransferase [Clostridia bacterium]
MIIATKRLILRPFSIDDDSDVYEYCKNENVGKNAGWKPHADINETREIMKKFFFNNDNAFAIVFDGKVVGSLGIMPDNLRDNDHSFMIGYALSEDYWGKGIMTEACKAFLRYVFDNNKLHILSVTCFDDNPRSENVIFKCGFEFEGILHNAYPIYNGETKNLKFFYLTRQMYQDFIKRL